MSDSSVLQNAQPRHLWQKGAIAGVYVSLWADVASNRTITIHTQMGTIYTNKGIIIAIHEPNQLNGASTSISNANTYTPTKLSA